MFKLLNPKDCTYTTNYFITIPQPDASPRPQKSNRYHFHKFKKIVQAKLSHHDKMCSKATYARCMRFIRKNMGIAGSLPTFKKWFRDKPEIPGGG